MWTERESSLGEKDDGCFLEEIRSWVFSTKKVANRTVESHRAHSMSHSWCHRLGHRNQEFREFSEVTEELCEG